MSIVKDLFLTILFLISLFGLLIYENIFVSYIFICVVFLFLIKKYRNLKQELTDERNYFTQTLSHDLRVSTIAQIRGIELLQKNPDKEILDEVYSSCKYTLEMVTMLLNTYRFKSKEDVLQKETFSLIEVVEPLNEKYGFKTIMDENSWVNADKYFLMKVLNILISISSNNSFSDSTMVLKIKKREKFIQISIAYQGKPLSYEEQARMFERNPQYSTVGYGIKMNLCKKIVEFHGGKISVNSDFEHYNIFEITLPQETLLKNSTPFLSQKVSIST